MQTHALPLLTRRRSRLHRPGGLARIAASVVLAATAYRAGTARRPAGVGSRAGLAGTARRPAGVGSRAGVGRWIGAGRWAGAARLPAEAVHRADGGHRTDAGDRAGDARQAGVAAFRPDVSAATLRRGRLVALGVGGFLLPWCVLLGVTLPATAQVQNWSLAWVGLDAGEAIAALSTAMLLARADSRASVTAAAGGALLVADAWFDVCTSAPDYRVALAEAVFVELPLAGAAFWLAARLGRGRAGADWGRA